MDHAASSPFSIHGLPREFAYQKIDAEISNLEDRIRALRTLRNSLSPISSMPPELLSRVFLYSCGLNESIGLFDNYFDEDGEESEPDVHCWMRLTVTWVSRHWRQVAHGYPQLWNLIYSDEDKRSATNGYVDHCYRLSSGLGVCVDLYDPTDETIQASMSKLNQVQFLSIMPGCLNLEELENFRLVPLSGSEWKQPAPILRRLGLHQASITDRNLFTGIFPRLTHLGMYQCEFNWDIPLFSCPALATLHIVNPVKRITIPKLLDLLQGLPYIATCDLSYCIQAASDPGPRVSRRVSLEGLKMLDLQDELDLISNVLLKLDIPETSISIAMCPAHSSNSVKRTLTQFQQDIGREWNAVDGIKSFQSSSSCRFSLSTSTTTTYKFFFDAGDKHLDLNFVAFACQNLPLENLHSCSTDCLSTEAATLLGNLRHLNQLRLIKGPAVRPFIAALHDINESIPTPPKTTPFPALQDLGLVNMDTPSAYDGLLEVLTTRKAEGIGLERLTFSKSKVSIQDTAPLALVIGVVTADHW
ncbi:hypothetical protein BDN72DRAFT_848436 [Pluteus cervinus]|uniref:Uncharacterized protein n=1 Tax=Pluteus cervinus TaxID=181527 RepID=A0ACD3AAL9_9AGAR|nr:hypothetical protein BDN72DRAFT_848436 [Pluteus cervinus]